MMKLNLQVQYKLVVTIYFLQLFHYEDRVRFAASAERRVD